MEVTYSNHNPIWKSYLSFVYFKTSRGIGLSSMSVSSSSRPFSSAYPLISSTVLFLPISGDNYQ